MRAGLHRDIGNQRISDHNCGDAIRQWDQLGLIDIDRDGVVSGAGHGSGRAQQNSHPNEPTSKNARAPRRMDLIDILYPGALTSRLKRYAADRRPTGQICRQ